MSAVALQRPLFLKLGRCGIKTLDCKERTPGSWKISASFSSSEKRKAEEAALLGHFEPIAITTSPSKLQFDRLQAEDQGLIEENRLEFGEFVAREAVLDEEFWTAAWLRAESHWEDRRNDRYADNYKRKFAEQEFNALKRRSRAKLGHKSTCVVAVKKENRDVKKRTVVGTLDLSIQYFSQQGVGLGLGLGLKAPPFFGSRDTKSCHPPYYGYIANLCVAKSARRLGVAHNMLFLAIRSAKARGAEQVFVHVYRYNTPARQLYCKMGFEEVEVARFDHSEESILLLRLQTIKSG